MALSPQNNKLTPYGDTPISYDAIDNPLTYKGYTLTWQNGRQLASMKIGTINIGFTYDVDGLRTSKTIFNVDLEHKYYYVGSRLQYETIGDDSAMAIRESSLDFFDNNSINNLDLTRKLFFKNNKK